MIRLSTRYSSSEKAEPQTLTLRLDRRRGLVRDWNDSILIFKEWNLNPEYGDK